MTDPGRRVDTVDGAGLPHPELLVRLNGFLMVAGGALLATRVAPLLAAGVLLASTGATTLVGHPFWRLAPGHERDRQIIQFLKNTGLIGGLLLVVAHATAGA